MLANPDLPASQGQAAGWGRKKTVGGRLAGLAVVNGILSGLWDNVPNDEGHVIFQCSIWLTVENEAPNL